MYCETPNSEARRRAADLVIQGIDYVDVLDFAAPNEDLRHRFLLVHFFDTVAGLSAQNVDISAAREAPPLHVVWALPASPLDQPPLLYLDDGVTRPFTSEELDFLRSATPDPSRVLLVHISHTVPVAENMTVYTISSIFTDASIETDPRITSYSFTLNAEGDVDVDCGPAAMVPNNLSTSPPLDYLAKDYASFRRLMMDRMAVVMPDWKQRNTADIGVALVEMLAYVGDQLSYYQDAVATEAYLGTARRRMSVRRHARLLDYSLHEGNNARVWVCLDVGPGFVNTALHIPSLRNGCGSFGTMQADYGTNRNIGRAEGRGVVEGRVDGGVVA